MKKILLENEINHKEHRCLDTSDFCKIVREGGTVKYGIQSYLLLALEGDQALLSINKNPTWVDIKELK